MIKTKRGKKPKNQIKSNVCSFTVFIVFVIFSTLLVFISTSVFWIIRSSYLSISYSDVSTKSSLDEISSYLRKIMLGIEVSVNSLIGDKTVMGEYLYSIIEDNNQDSFRKAVYKVFGHSRAMSEMLGFSEFELGFYFYENLKWVKQFSYAHGNLWIGNGTYNANLTEYRIVDPLPHETSTEEIYWKTGETGILEVAGMLEYLSLELHFWDYWFGEISGQLSPFLSFSFRETLQIGDHVTACEIWFGSDLFSVSKFLKEITLSGGMTFVLEVDRDYLLASSDALYKDDLAHNGNFISGKDYTRNKILPILTTYIMDSEGVLDKIKSGEMEKFTYLGYHIYTSYLNSSKYDGEWIVVNALPSWMIYNDSVISIIITVIVTIFLIAMMVIIWSGSLLSLGLSFIAIINEFNKVEKMQLNEVNDLTKRFNFWELGLLVKKFMFMVEKLKEYRSFLPSYLLEDEYADDEKSEILSSNNSSAYLESEGSVKKKSNGSLKQFAEGIRSLNSNESLSNINKFQLGLTRNIVCLMRIIWKKEEPENHDPDVFDRIFSLIRPYRGHIYHFGASFINVLFNSSKPHLPLYAQEKIVSDDFLKSRLKWIKVFICQEKSLSGNVGYNNAKTFACEGKVIEKTNTMENINGFNVKCMVNELFCENLDDIYIFREIPALTLPFRVYQIGGRNHVEMDEWMYELQQKEILEKWKVYNDGVRLYHEKNYKLSLERFKEYLDNDPTDEMCRKWMEYVLQKV